MNTSQIDLGENRRRMLKGELYYAFVPDLSAARRRCELACQRFNSAGDVSRREQVRLWRDILGDSTPLPAATGNNEADEQALASEPFILAPIRVDYGTNVRVGPGSFINFNCTILDTCQVTIGARTLLGPNVSIYAASHPEDPYLRKGTEGPEMGKDVVIKDDAWIGGNVLILPGVTIGNGAIVGAGSVVTKDVPDMWIAAGNPARLLRAVRTSQDTSNSQQYAKTQSSGVASTLEKAAPPALPREQDDRQYHDEDQGW